MLKTVAGRLSILEASRKAKKQQNQTHFGWMKAWIICATEARKSEF